MGYGLKASSCDPLMNKYNCIQIIYTRNVHHYQKEGFLRDRYM